MTSCPACGKENEDAAVLCRRCRGPLRDEPEEHIPEESAPDAHHGAPAPVAAHDPANEQPAATADEPAASSESLGEVCRRCDSYNEPGARRCGSCGYMLVEDPPGPPQEQPGPPSVADELSALAISPEEAAEAGLSPPAHGVETRHGEPPLDKTPPQAFSHPAAEVPSLVTRSKVAVAEAAGVALGAVTGVAAGAAAAVAGVVRRTPEPTAPLPTAPSPLAPPGPLPIAKTAPELKACAECASLNPAVAKFCFDCGTPFARKSAAPPSKLAEPQPKAVELALEPSPKGWAENTEPGGGVPAVRGETLDSTSETFPISLDEEPERFVHPQHEVPSAHEAPERVFEPVSPVSHEQAVQVEHLDHESVVLSGLPVGFEQPAATEHPVPAEIASALDAVPFEEAAPHESAAWDETPVEELADPLPEPSPVEELAEPLPEPEPPFQASLVFEKGPFAGTALALVRLENSIGGAGACIEFADDPSVAPHAATLAFADDRLVLRDEGTANGVYVRIREKSPIEAGDHFYAGERLLRFDGPCDLPQTHEGEVPFLGAPRPPGLAVRLVEVVEGGKTGRTCHRSGPTISIGRTGCDMNFPTDSLLGARHAEVRLADDGTVSLVDLGQGPSGIFVRVRARGAQELQAGDIVRVGEQDLRVEIGP